MRITKDLQITCDFLEKGLGVTEYGASASEVLSILVRNNAFVKGEFFTIYEEIVFQYRYVGNVYRSHFLFDVNREEAFSNFRRKYFLLKDALLKASQQLEDWKQLKFLDAERLLTLMYNVVALAVEQEIITSSLYKNVTELHKMANEKA